MGVLKKAGKISGIVAGTVIGGPVYIAGMVLDSDLLCDIGEGAYTATECTGELLGIVTEGVVEKTYGMVKKDSDKLSKGFEKVIQSGGSYIKGVEKWHGKDG